MYNYTQSGFTATSTGFDPIRGVATYEVTDTQGYLYATITKGSGKYIIRTVDNVRAAHKNLSDCINWLKNSD